MVKKERINQDENERKGICRNLVGHLGRMPRDTGVAWRHRRSIMTRATERERIPEESDREKENWRAFLVYFVYLSLPPPRIRSSSPLPSFFDPFSAKPVASPSRRIPPSDFFGKFALFSSDLLARWSLAAALNRTLYTWKFLRLLMHKNLCSFELITLSNI